MRSSGRARAVPEALPRIGRMTRPPSWRQRAIGLLLALAGGAAGAQTAEPAPRRDATPPAAAPATPVSPSAQRLYERARGQLVQVRTLLKGQDSQSSVGSGFFVGDDGLIVTNYHVVSQFALQPGRYRLSYTRVDGREGALQLLGIDAIHDLALVRALPADGARRDAAAEAPPGAPLSFRPADAPLAQGERIYAMGNPLDVGFAVLEGTYNGLVERSFYPSIFFGGALNSGMSGGPALDEGAIGAQGRLDARGVSFDNAMKLAAHYLRGYGLKEAP